MEKIEHINSDENNDDFATLVDVITVVKAIC